MVFLDTNPVIYFVEQTPNWGAKATARIVALRAAGQPLAVSDLVRMESMVGPLKANDPLRLADFTAFFTAPDVKILPITAAVCDRAARIRAQYGFKPLDSLHLADGYQIEAGLATVPDAPGCGLAIDERAFADEAKVLFDVRA